jgi:hypothetical protein
LVQNRVKQSPELEFHRVNQPKFSAKSGPPHKVVNGGLSRSTLLLLSPLAVWRSPSLELTLLCTPRPHTAATLTRCAASPFPRPLPCHRVVAVKPALSRVRWQCPTPLSRPLPSPAAASSIALLRASRSPHRGNPHAHRPAMPDVPTHAPPLRSPCPFSFIMTSGNAFEWRKIRRIYHAWSQAVDACTG